MRKEGDKGKGGQGELRNQRQMEQEGVDQVQARLSR